MRLNGSTLLVIGIATFTGCSESNVPSPKCDIRTYANEAGTVNETYTYANSKLVKITDKNGYRTFSYDQQGRVGSVTYYYTGSVFTYTYSYDGNNRLVSRNGQFPTTYLYNSSGQLIKQSNSDGSYSEFTYPDTITSNFSSLNNFDASGNITKTESYVYDSKTNPFYILLYNFFDGQVDDIPTPNNVIQLTVTISGQPSILSSVYTYDSHGYPTAVDAWYGKATITYSNCPY